MIERITARSRGRLAVRLRLRSHLSSGIVKDPRAEAIARAHAIIRQALYPHPTEVRVREGLDDRVLEKWSEASRLLTQAEDQFDTGVGGGAPDEREGLRLVAEARDAIEWARGLHGSMDAGMRDAFARVLQVLDNLLG
jgi:hypothetical protein